MDELYIKFETMSGIEYRPVRHIWRVLRRDGEPDYEVCFHTATGDFDNKTLSPEEMTQVKPYSEWFGRGAE